MVIDIDGIFIPVQPSCTTRKRSETVVSIDRPAARPFVSAETAETECASRISKTNSSSDKLRATVACFFAGGCF